MAYGMSVCSLGVYVFYVVSSLFAEPGAGDVRGHRFAIVRMHVCVCVRTYVRTYVRMHVCTYVRTYVRMYVYTYIYIYIYIYTHTHTHIYIYISHMHTHYILASRALRVVRSLSSKPLTATSSCRQTALSCAIHTCPRPCPSLCVNTFKQQMGTV